MAREEQGAVNEAGGARNMPIHEAARLGYLECLHVLLQHGASTNSRDSAGATPLILAVKHKRYTVAEVRTVVLANTAVTSVT